MEIAARTLPMGLSPKILNYRPTGDGFTPNILCTRACFYPQMRINARNFWRERRIHCPTSFVALSGAESDLLPSDVEDVGVSCEFEDFSVTNNGTNNGELKISVEVSGRRTRAIFNDIFDKMVAAAQPIRGFRRVKGGTTPNIPRDILLEILGPTNVYKQVIKKVINSTLAEYVEKEGLKVRKDLRIEQSFEDLEEMFEPDERFSFDAVMKLQETN